MIDIDNIPHNKKYINIRVERLNTSTVNNWDRVCLHFTHGKKNTTNAYYVNGLKVSDAVIIRNIPIPKGTTSLKLTPVGEFHITAALIDESRLQTEFEKKLIQEQLEYYNGQYFFHYPSKVQPKKLVITLPGMGNNIDSDSQYSVMTMKSFPFRPDIYRVHLIDLFWANGSCLIFDEEKKPNIDNIINLIDGILEEKNLSASDCHIITASKGCFAGYEIMKQRKYNFAFFAPITNVERFNENSPVMRFISRELVNNGYKFFKPDFNENAVVYTSLKDPGIDLGLVSKCVSTIDNDLMHAQITKRFINEYLSSESLIA